MEWGRLGSTAYVTLVVFGGLHTDPGSITQTDLGYREAFRSKTEWIQASVHWIATGGLMDYKARFYSPLLGRFIQPDTIIPNPTNPQAFNRFVFDANRGDCETNGGNITCSTEEKDDYWMQTLIHEYGHVFDNRYQSLSHWDNAAYGTGKSDCFTSDYFPSDYMYTKDGCRYVYELGVRQPRI